MRIIQKGGTGRGGSGREVVNRGFSLVELIIVLAILLLVAFMSREGYLRERTRQRQKTCARNLAGQYVAFQTFANDHAGRFPYLTNAASPSEPLSLLIPKYTTQTEFWICPGSGDRALPPARPFAGRKISYAYYMGWRKDSPPEAVLASDEQIDAAPRIAQQLAFSPDGEGPGSNHGADGGNFLRADGSQDSSPSHASVPFPVPEGITLLNPSPR